MKLISVFILLYFSFQLVPAQVLSSVQNEKLNTLVEGQVERIAPGIAVGIVKNGNTIYSKYSGYANLEHQVAVNETTRFNIASNAKQFVALMVLNLAQEGKIKLTDDIRKYLPEMYSEIKEEITISQVITHRSGIRDVYSLMALQGKTWWAELGYSNGDAIELLQQQKTLNFKPGSDYMYSNSNYILLTKIVEVVIDVSFPEYSEEFFKKLGMANTVFCSDYMATIPNKARPYANWGSWKEYPSVTEMYGDGALFSTLEDQIAWEKSVQTLSNDFLSAETIKKSQGKAYEKGDYGFGLELKQYKGLEMNYHDGQTGAYNANFLRFPTENLSVVVISNSGQVGANYLAKQIAKVVIDPSKWSVPDYPVGPKKLQKEKEIEELLGYYESQDGTILRFIQEEGKFFWKIGQNRPFEFELVKKNLYQMVENNKVKIAFESEKGNVVKMVRYYPELEPMHFEKYQELTVSDNDLEAFNGSYFNSEVGIEFCIKYVGEKKFDVSIFGKTSKAEMLIEYQIEVEGFTLLMKEELGLKKIVAEDYRTKNLIFSRKD